MSDWFGKRSVEILDLRFLKFVLVSHFLVSCGLSKITLFVAWGNVLDLVVVSCVLVINLSIRLHPFNLRMCLSWQWLWLWWCAVDWLDGTVRPVYGLTLGSGGDGLSLVPIHSLINISLSILFIDTLLNQTHHIFLAFLFESAGDSGLAGHSSQCHSLVAAWRSCSGYVLWFFK